MEFTFSRVIVAVLGFSTSVLYLVPKVNAWHSQKTATEKLKLINEALEQADERALRLQERHDRILAQICSFYLTHKELGEALAGARATMNEALEFATRLRRMQIKLIASFPLDHVYGGYMLDG